MSISFKISDTDLMNFMNSFWLEIKPKLQTSCFFKKFKRSLRVNHRSLGKIHRPKASLIVTKYLRGLISSYLPTRVISRNSTKPLYFKIQKHFNCNLYIVNLLKIDRKLKQKNALPRNSCF